MQIQGDTDIQTQVNVEQKHQVEANKRAPERLVAPKGKAEEDVL